ncbi:HRDC domain-containing protein [Paenibacillus gallinarum]|uniref:HRDC domain-containing protein n=1 Tax=Paenibacillus gallinarum TaxID=2762232 RepID=A0ABR8SU41_9BACL|nr:HRDC domain-containing protein [Paenibacillus gallinarum]MBD7966889.1 HRDC domain-containing protein [Paenibacillus gallinarum]
MKIVFMVQLSVTSEQNGAKYAQLWIGEEEDLWQLGWSSMNMDKEQVDIWYEGSSWNEMMHIYRFQLAIKMSEGYRPLIEGIFHESEETKQRNQHTQKLQCYSELYGREELYQALCVWRRKKASTERKAPYFIASNRLLRMISTFVPHTLEELRELPGVGENKLTEYGQELLDITTKETREHGFPLNWVSTVLTEEEYESWNYRQKEQKYKQELDKFNLKKSVLTAIASSQSLDDISALTGLNRRELVDFLEELEKSGYDTEMLIAKELTWMTDDEQELIWNAYDELGTSFLKPILHQVYGEDPAGAGPLDQLYERLRMVRIRYRRQTETSKQVG